MKVDDWRKRENKPKESYRSMAAKMRRMNQTGIYERGAIEEEDLNTRKQLEEQTGDLHATVMKMRVKREKDGNASTAEWMDKQSILRLE